MVRGGPQRISLKRAYFDLTTSESCIAVLVLDAGSNLGGLTQFFDAYLVTGW